MQIQIVDIKRGFSGVLIAPITRIKRRFPWNAILTKWTLIISA